MHQERRASPGQLVFKPRRTVTVPARPWFGAILITTLPPIMSVLNFGKFEVLFPIGLLLLERRRAVANLDPASRSIGAQTRAFHVAETFAFGNRALSQGLVFNRFQQLLFPTRLQLRPYQITHVSILRRFKKSRSWESTPKMDQ